MPVVNVYTLQDGTAGTTRELYTQLTAGQETPVAYSTFRHRIDYGWRDRDALLQPRQVRAEYSARGGSKHNKTYHLDDGFSGTLGACVKYLKGRGWRLPPEKTVRDRLYRGITDIDRLRVLRLTGEATLPRQCIVQPLQVPSRTGTKRLTLQQKCDLVENPRCQQSLPDCREWAGWQARYIRPGALNAYPELRIALKVST